MSRLFDNYIMVDWSASTKPNTGNDSIWIGLLRRDVRLQLRFEYLNPPTRLQAFNHIVELLQGFNKRGDKTLIGFDFSLGFPQGTAQALKLDGEPWQAMQNFLAKEIIDKADNSNNRFSVASKINRLISNGPFPFWGCPARDILTTLQPKKTKPHEEGGLPEYRLSEKRAKAASSVWKLYSPGSVGSQTLTGIPHVKKLLEAFENARLWPYQMPIDGLNKDALENVDIVLTEIYPSMLKVKAQAGETKDLTQVRAIAEHFANIDDNGKLGDYFNIAKCLSEEEQKIVTAEEGWILGIK